MPHHDPSTRLQRWRASRLMTVTVWVVFAFFVFEAVAVQLDGSWTPSSLLVGAVLLCLGAFFPYVASGHVDLFPDAVVIGGLLRRRRELPLSSIEAVEPGRYGLHFRTGAHGVVVGPSAIGQKGWAQRLLRIQSRGDLIAARVMAQASTERSRGGRGASGAWP